MHLAITKTRATIGIIAHPVAVEVHLSNGLPSFNIVGLAQTAV
ncbi:MAG TPA: magnesium chelatase subunit ChlI, partial [Legionellaceae bacterium]|nr:magnesium chelatase subunit ChlI [Legionellaceae bacterium]